MEREENKLEMAFDPQSFPSYISTWVLVSGSRSPTKPPHTRTEEAKRIGIDLVMITKEPNIRFPRTAAALHSAFKKPKPVALKGRERKREREKRS